MSVHIPCTCKGSRTERIRSWYVSERKCNYSTFEYPRGEYHPSEYSTVKCSKCQMNIRSKGKFVDLLPDGGEINVSK